MANQPHQKLKILRILQMLFEQTDNTHGLTTQEIVDNLAAQGIPAERKAIYRDIKYLNSLVLLLNTPTTDGVSLNAPYNLKSSLCSLMPCRALLS